MYLTRQERSLILDAYWSILAESKPPKLVEMIGKKGGPLFVKSLGPPRDMLGSYRGGIGPDEPSAKIEDTSPGTSMIELSGNH